MITKRHVARWIQLIVPLRWGLWIGARLLAPKNYVGAVGAIFNHTGQVLMVEHVFRPDYPWGLPGGWVDRGENPAHTVQREVKEELNLTVEVKKLLVCELQGGHENSSTPSWFGLGLLLPSVGR